MYKTIFSVDYSDACLSHSVDTAISYDCAGKTMKTSVTMENRIYTYLTKETGDYFATTKMQDMTYHSHF